MSTESKMLDQLAAHSHGGFIHWDDDKNAPEICHSDVFDGELTVSLDGEFCKSELIALVTLMMLQRGDS